MDAELAQLIRDIPDFPIKGILFRDITTLLKEGQAFQKCIDRLVEQLVPLKPEKIVAIESRGFIFGAPIAYKLGAGFVPVRKLGKLPAETVSAEYELEYGTNSVEIHRDAIAEGARVLIVDDLLATGGTVGATVDLVRQLGGNVVATAFLIELKALNGRAHLDGPPVISVITF